MSYVRFSVSRMFVFHDPAECSGSQFELGPYAGRITWNNALAVAQQHLDGEQWLIPVNDDPLGAALDYIRRWAKETGAWDKAEIESWSEAECLALLVQNVASDMRQLGSDDEDLLDCYYTEGSEIAESGIVSGWYWVEGDELLGELCS